MLSKFLGKNGWIFGKKWQKFANFRRFLGIGVSATLAEYSVPNIRPIFAEYSAEYSVFGRTLLKTKESSSLDEHLLCT